MQTRAILTLLLITTIFLPSVNAASLTPSYTDGGIISNMESLSEWIPGGTGVSAALDTINFIEGYSSIKLSTTSGPVYITKSLTADLSSVTQFSLWIYVNDIKMFDTAQVYFSSSSSKYFKAVVGPSEVVPGWNHLVMAKSQFTNYGGESWSTITSVKIRLTARGAEACSFDAFTYDMQARTKCILTFDDGSETAYTVVKPILDANSQKAVLFVNPYSIGDSGKLTLSQLNILYAEGWDISDHTYSHQDLNHLTAINLEQQVNGGYTWLVSHGFGQTAQFFAYPYGYGYDNATVVAKIKENHVLARSVIWDTWQGPLSDSMGDSLYALKCYGVKSTTTLDALKARIDLAIQQRGTCIFMFHSVSDTNPTSNPYCTLTQQFQEFSDYMASKSADIEVCTLSSLYTSPPPPPPVTYAVALTQTAGGIINLQPMQPTYEYGTIITLTAIPDPGYTFTSWNGVQGTNPSTLVQVNSNLAVSATFTPLSTYTITASAGTGGTISPSGSISVQDGGSAAFTITPSTGYRISSVRVDGVSVGAVSTYTFNSIKSAHTISATFTPITYTIQASASWGGRISPSGSVTVKYGASQKFTFTPSYGYKISKVVVDGVSMGAITSYTFTSIKASHKISVTFVRK